MYMRLTGGRVKPGCWEQYERAYRRYVEPLAPARGLLGQWLIKAKHDPDLGFSITLWDTLAHMEAYERSDAVRRQILPHMAQYLSGEFLAHHCEVRYQDLFDLGEVRAGIQPASDPTLKTEGNR